MGNIPLRDISEFKNAILTELAYNIHLGEHRLRYQFEQEKRLSNSLNAFKFKAIFSNFTVDDFINAYNNFLWKSIAESHGNLSPKIEANYRGGYHEGNVSPVTSLLFNLYFQHDKFKRFISKVLASSYRNPYTEKQKTFI